jgi:hypothetical protein
MKTTKYSNLKRFIIIFGILSMITSIFFLLLKNIFGFFVIYGVVLVLILNYKFVRWVEVNIG